MRIVITAAYSGIRADLTRRTIFGTLVRFGETGYTNVGPLIIDADADLRFPADLADVPLTREHDKDVVRGSLAMLDINDERIYTATKAADGPAGDAALAEAIDRGPSGRGGLSVVLDNAQIVNGHVRAADVVAIGQVHDPAFNASRIDQVAASRHPQTPGQPGPTKENSMTPEQIARLAALRGQATLTQDEAAELATLAALETAQPAEPTTPATDPATPAAPADPAPAAAQPVAAARRVPAVPAVPAGATGLKGTTTTKARSPYRAMLDQLVSAFDAHRKGTGNLVQGITAALSDITSGDHTDNIEPVAWSDELWSGLEYEPAFLDAFSTGQLTSYKGKGWRFTTKLSESVDDYAGDKAEVPTGTVTTAQSEYEAARMAIAVDVDRKFYDFGVDATFLDGLFQQAREGFTIALDTKVRAYVQTKAKKATRTIAVSTTNADATITGPDGTFTAADVGASITGTGIPANATIASVTDGGEAELSANATATGAVTATIDAREGNLLKTMGRLAQAATKTRIGTLSSIFANDDDVFDLFNLTNLDLPAYLDLLGIKPEQIKKSPDLARGTVYGTVKPAAKVYQLPGSPIRVDAQDLVHGGVDTGFFSYWAIEEHHTSGILKATYVPTGA